LAGYLLIHSIKPQLWGRIDTASRKFFRYAWSDNIGWISFNAADLAGCPLVPALQIFNLALIKFRCVRGMRRNDNGNCQSASEQTLDAGSVFLVRATALRVRAAINRLRLGFYLFVGFRLMDLADRL